MFAFGSGDGGILVYYHTFKTGIRFKNIAWTAPPRSLYTDLPRKFCFRETTQAPMFLKKCKHRTVQSRLKDKSNRWFVLNI